MLVRRLPVVLLFLIKALEAAVPSRSDLYALADTTTVPSISQLSGQLAQLEIKGPEVKADNAEPLLSVFEISKRMEALMEEILGCDAKTAVEMIEKELVQILDSGICLNDIVPTIGTLPIEAKELVLTALELKAHTLLNLLQMVYIWRDDHQYHWFMALIENEPWRNKELKNDHVFFPLNWRKNFRAICETDNVALAAILREQALQKGTLGRLDEELVPLCAEYDAIKVFESTKLDPVKLGEHFKLLAKHSAVKLLRFYQIHTKTPHLHLEEFPLPIKLPKDVEGFKFLMENGYNYLPMDEFIGKFCKEGRVDLLKYLQTLNPVLIPEILDLQYAAEENSKDILDWARQFVIEEFKSFNYPICQTLLANNHFDTLFWWIDVNKIIVDQTVLLTIARSGALKVLQWADSRALIKNGDIQEVADTASRHRHLHILEWLYEKYEILPKVECFYDATTEMLDWIKPKSYALQHPHLVLEPKDSDLSYENLLHHGASNLQLLKWAFNNAPLSVFSAKRKFLSERISSTEMMMWLYENLKICPSNMEWAYLTEDSEAIKWATEHCGLRLAPLETFVEANTQHLSIMKWASERTSLKNTPYASIDALEAAIDYGDLEVAECLSASFFPEKGPNRALITDAAISGGRPATTEWIRKHNFEIELPSEDGQTFGWTFVNLSIKTPIIEAPWGYLRKNDLHRSYRWFLERHPKVRDSDELTNDALEAYKWGSLGILKVLHEKYPLVLGSLPQNSVTRLSYHINQWLAAHGYLVKQA